MLQTRRIGPASRRIRHNPSFITDIIAYAAVALLFYNAGVQRQDPTWTKGWFPHQWIPVFNVVPSTQQKALGTGPLIPAQWHMVNGNPEQVMDYSEFIGKAGG